VFFSAVCQDSVSTPTLALRDHAALVLVHVLDRVLDRDDVAAGLLVAIADHRRERRGLARAGAADQDHEAALGQHDLLEDGRQVELLDRRNLALIRRMHAAGLALLHEGVDAEAADAGGAIAKLHSLVESNSFDWRSFMMARVSVADCSGVSARSLCGRTSPSILIAGGKPA
jgi:hypothetical protein